MNKHVLAGPLGNLTVDGVCIGPSNSFTCLDIVVAANLYATIDCNRAQDWKSLGLLSQVVCSLARFCTDSKSTVLLAFSCPPPPSCGVWKPPETKAHTAA